MFTFRFMTLFLQRHYYLQLYSNNHLESVGRNHEFKAKLEEGIRFGRMDAINATEVQTPLNRPLWQPSINWNLADGAGLEPTCARTPRLSRSDLYHLGESIHFEIERGMAFLFRKMMTLGRHGLKELLLVAGYCLAQVLRDRIFVTSSWQIFRS